MVAVIDELCNADSDFDDDVQDFLEDYGVSTVRGLTLSGINKLYKEALESKGAPKPTKKTKMAYKENNVRMSNLIANAIDDEYLRTVNITIEDERGRFLSEDGKWKKRKMGEPVPIYMSMPKEVYNAIVN